MTRELLLPPQKIAQAAAKNKYRDPTSIVIGNSRQPFKFLPFSSLYFAYLEHRKTDIPKVRHHR